MVMATRVPGITGVQVSLVGGRAAGATLTGKVIEATLGRKAARGPGVTGVQVLAVMGRAVAATPWGGKFRSQPEMQEFWGQPGREGC